MIGLRPIGFATLLLVNACGAGERSIDSAITGVDTCPSGETCSASTPGGLTFRRGKDGKATSNAPFNLARGGTQEITVATARTGVLLPEFDAKSTSPTMVTEITKDRTVRLTGVAEGAGYLRIVDVGTDLLEDRIKLSVKEVDRVLIQPTTVFLPGGGASDVSVLTPASPGASASVDLRVVLRSADDYELADDGVTMEGHAPASRAIGTTWSMSARSSSGKATSMTLVIMAAIDDLEVMTAPVGALAFAFPPITEKMVDGVAHCFDARSGGRSTVGVALTFTHSENLDLDAANNCAIIMSHSVGPAWISATGGGHSRRLDFEVAAPTKTKSAPESGPSHLGERHLGERAAASVVAE